MATIDCYTSEDYLGDFIRVASRTIDDMAQVAYDEYGNLFNVLYQAIGALEYYEVAKEIRQYAAFVLSFKVRTRTHNNMNNN